MNIFCLSLDEIQRIRLSYSVDFMAQMFEMTRDEMYVMLRELEILSPADFVRALGDDHFILKVAALGHTEAAKFWNVSKSFIRKEVARRMTIEIPSQEFLEGEIRRWKSPSLVANMYKLPKSQLPTVDVVDKYVHLGNFTVSIGRKAELFVLDLIGGRDMNEEDTRSLYDIDHEEHGKINVKLTSKRPWRAPKTDNCDHVCLVAAHPKTGSYVYVALIPADLCPVTAKSIDHLPKEAIILHRGKFSL